MRRGLRFLGGGQKPGGLSSLFKGKKSTFHGLPVLPYALTNKNNLRVANAVLRPDGTAGGGAAIGWTLLNTGGHDYDFFTAIAPSGGDLFVDHPAAKIHAAIIKPDESFGANIVFPSYNAALSTPTQLCISAYQKNGTYGGRLVGNGTNWDLVGDLTLFDSVTNTISDFTFNPPKQITGGTNAQNAACWNGAFARYNGITADRRIFKILTGLGSASFGYQLQVASTGAAVSSNSSDDVIEIFTGTQKMTKLNHGLNDSNGWPGANIFTVNSNYWVSIIYELI